ncbi:hypothetical protein CRYUN_Cryun33cG0035700 [Craigia yunnanensis]
MLVMGIMSPDLLGLMNFTSLSFKKSDAITAEGMRAFSSLVDLEKLDLERCSGIHGGFVHIKGLSKLESLNIRCCKCITDLDLKAISGNFDKFFGLIEDCYFYTSGVFFFLQQWIKLT